MNLKDLKSIHFIPGHKTNFLEYILKNNLKPDGLVFDLEDSVSLDAKILARENLLKMYAENKEEISRYAVIIRPNKENSPYFKEDFRVIELINPNFILMPKVESSIEVENAKKFYKNKPIILAIETINGVNKVDSIISSLDKNDAVVIGYEDLSAQLEIDRPQDLSSVNPLTQLIFEVYIAARKYQIIIFDAVCRFYKNEDLHILEKECAFTSGFRFSGKFSIHPNQINIINNYFDKSKIQDYAEEIVNQFSQVVDGSAVIVKDNQMLDTPSLKLYQKYKR